MESEKRISCIVLDAAPLLLNQPSVSTLLATAEHIYTVPAVVAEIKDPNARQRLETTVLPFLQVRSPTPKSIEVIAAFAKKSGDFAVLSRPDLHVLALAYELECEKNHGDWRLRSTPGQKRLNGSPPPELASKRAAPASESETTKQPPPPTAGTTEDLSEETPPQASGQEEPASIDQSTNGSNKELEQVGSVPLTEQLEGLKLDSGADGPTDDADADADAGSEDGASGADSDGEWITPSNLQRHQQKDHNAATQATPPPSKMQVATITTDFALQNTLLLMNLNLLSASLSRISHLKSHILRCHACFATTKEMGRQFCDRCGGPTLTRVTCSTSANGEFKLHLKSNMQWSHRGDRYSIPKAVAGTSSGKLGKGGRGKGGKGGWGQELVLSEDQKEYTRAVSTQERQRSRDIMDPDYLPSILTGERGAANKVKVGAGRTVNSKKR